MSAIDDLAAYMTNGNGNGHAQSSGPDAVAQIRRALLEDAQDTRDADGPVREEVPGTAGLLHRGIACLFFADRGAGKSMVIKVIGASAAATGEKVLYLDRENGAALTLDHMRGILDAHDDWPDVLDNEAFAGRHWPEVTAAWSPDAYGEAVAGAGFTVVVYDSFREFISQLGGDPDREQDITKFMTALVTPLLRRGVAVVVLDNVGHSSKGRPKGSASKLDAIPQGYLVETTAPFTPATVGAIKVTCARSRYGDLDRAWSMRIGGDVFDVPKALGEDPDEKRARAVTEARAKFHRACLVALADRDVMGRDALLKAARQHGAKGRALKLRNWLAEFAADPASGFDRVPDGYVLTPGPEKRDQGGTTPPADPLVPLVPALKGTRAGTPPVPMSGTTPGTAGVEEATAATEEEEARIARLLHREGE